MKSFESLGLKKQLISKLHDLSFVSPTNIQSACIPSLLKFKDIVATSPTGTGKTLSFILPIVQDIIKTNRHYHSLIILPTRDLAMQTFNTLNQLTEEIGLRAALLVGSTDEKKQKRDLFKTAPHVIIGTVGRLTCITKLLKKLRYLIIDECDVLHDSYEKDLKVVIEGVKSECTALFTATMTSKVNNLIKYLKDPIRIGIDLLETRESLVQKYLFMGFKLKEAYLYDLVRGSGKSMIIFTNSCLSVQTLKLFLVKMNIQALALYGSLSLDDRRSVVESFKNEECSILVATDLAARGLDIKKVELIVNYEMVAVREYIHRVGRTARGEMKGEAVTFVTQYDIDKLQRIEKVLGVKMGAWEGNKERVMEHADRVAIVYSEAYTEIKEHAEQYKRRRK